MSIEAESRTHVPGVPLPLVVLAGFGEQQAAELRALLEAECRVATARSAREARSAEKSAVLCLGALLSTIEARHFIAEAGDTDRGGPLLVLTGAGPDPAMFQDLIDADRLFYLSPGEPPPADLAALVRAALARRGAARARETVPAGLFDALKTARRVAAQPDVASAGDLLQLAAEEFVEADRVYCLLHDSDAETLWSRAAGMAREERRESSAVGLVSFVARTGCRLRLERAADDPRFEREADDPLGARCEHFLALPIRVPEPHAPVLAVLCAVRDPGRAPFSEEDEAALELLAATVAPSLAQLTLATRLESGERSRADLFRDEALEHHAAAGVREGDWLRLSPRWMSATLWLLVAMVAAFLGFAAVGTIGEYSTGPAVVRLAGRTEVTASQAGPITAVEVRPGDRVVAGQVLVRFQNAREAAELARIEREWELQLIERLRDLSAPAQALIGLRAERDLVRARLDERVVRAPRAGIVGDLRCRRDQHVAAGDILLSLTGTDAQPTLVAVLPGEHRPLLRAGMPLKLELRGYGHAPQRLVVAVVADEVVGPEEAKRLLGPEVATAVPLNGPLVRVEARFPSGTFEASGKRYALHDGMWGAAEVRVRSESLLAALVPGLRAVLERRRG
ncbi:MAG TPA: GAF domain-containing protein [Thermoanaerobaculia bacterium]|nr:GAF domain-containing protein [Thermoanaerobaculia bacterium]